MNKLSNLESKIIILKSRFFLTRTLGYFSFFLIPIYVQKSLVLPYYLKILLMVLYSAFMLGQWFLLGKEIDHRLKIYFEVNSSVDRIVYRLLLGMTFIFLVYNLLNFFTYKWSNNFFWFFWILCGLFYSWPTRGKIIEESVSTNFGDIKFLDSFEKTLLFLICVFFVFSVPEFPKISNYNELKTYFMTSLPLGSHFWAFLKMNYLPFLKYFSLFKVGFFIHFYFVGMGIFQLIFYSLLRHFFGRRLALLGVFAVISSWSFSKILSTNLISSHLSIYTVIWVWTGLWVVRSSTYKSGLFLGVIGFLIALIDPRVSLLILVHSAICYLFFVKYKMKWFQKQFFKYFSFGFILSILMFLFWCFFSKGQVIRGDLGSLLILQKNILHELSEKAVFSLSFLGAGLVCFKYIYPMNKKISSGLFIDMKKMFLVLISITSLALYAILIAPSMISGFAILWPIAFFCLIPIEFIFQLSTRFRSNRNIIYLMYILICLLDSHFEGRVKIFLKLFEIS